MRRPRLTVRGLVIAVAVVAVLLGTFEAGRRWERREMRQYDLGYIDIRGDVIVRPKPSSTQIVPVPPDPPAPPAASRMMLRTVAGLYRIGVAS